LYYDPLFFAARKEVLRPIADAIQRAWQRRCAGETYRLAISLPPRTGKSYIATLAAAWMIGNDPTGSVMRNTADATLYMKMSRLALNVMRSNKFRNVFDGVALKGGFQAIESWSVTDAKTVSYFGAGVGGRIVGEGCTLAAFTDDLFTNWASASSAHERDRVYEWMLADHDSRIEGSACRIDIGTRWSPDDVIGRLIEADYYNEVIVVPAMIDNRSFCEKIITTKALIEKKTLLPSEIWEAEWMQNPITAAGYLLPLQDLKLYDPTTIKRSAEDYALVVIDPADLGDHFAAPFTFIREGIVYIEDFLCNSDGLGYNVPVVVSMIERYRPNEVRIEGNGGWIQTAYDIRDELERRCPDVRVVIYKSTTNKAVRIESQSYFLREMTRFRNDWADDSDYSVAVKAITSYQKGIINKFDDSIECLSEITIFARNNNLM
jgi:hypothetical protein